MAVKWSRQDYKNRFLKFHYFFRSKYRIILTRLFFAAVLVIFCLGRNALARQTPVLSEVLFLFGATLVGIGVIGRAWSLSYIAGAKNKTLIVKGPYSLCRHPLYLFSFIGALGISFCTETLTVPAIILVCFALYYPFAIKKEELKMAARFGREYEYYAETVPIFFPSLRTFHEEEMRLINSKSFFRGLTSLIYFIVIIGLFELIESMQSLGLFASCYIIY